MQKIRIVLTGGGSGGHIYPLLAVVRELKKLGAEHGVLLDLRYFGPKDQFATLLEGDGVQLISIVSGKVRRYFSIQNIIDIPKFVIGLVQAFIKMFFVMPDAVFSKGGTGAFPVVFAAWFYHIPVVIHESDATPGLTNILSSKFAKRIAVSFEEAMQYFPPRKTALTGNPIRDDVLPPYIDQEVAKDSLGFHPKEPLMLVLGGSQGSTRINEFIVLHIASLLSLAQVLHQTGMDNIEEVKKLALASSGTIPEATRVKYKPVPYLDSKDMKNALAASDVVIARAGSGTIFEIASVGKPAILIPLQGAANDHQKANAYAFMKAGAAIVVEEGNLTVQIISVDVKKILSDQTVREKMSAAAHAFAKPDAAKMIAQEVLNLV